MSDGLNLKMITGTNKQEIQKRQRGNTVGRWKRKPKKRTTKKERNRGALDSLIHSLAEDLEKTFATCCDCVFCRIILNMHLRPLERIAVVKGHPDNVQLLRAITLIASTFDHWYIHVSWWLVWSFGERLSLADLCECSMCPWSHSD